MPKTIDDATFEQTIRRPWYYPGAHERVPQGATVSDFPADDYEAALASSEPVRTEPGDLDDTRRGVEGPRLLAGGLHSGRGRRRRRAGASVAGDRGVRGGAVICFTVPGQPQGKGRPRIGKVGQHARMFTPSKTVAYEGLVSHAAQQAMAGRVLLDGPCVVSMDIVCQVPASWSMKKQAQAIRGEIRPTTKPDIDNVEKAVFDGCNGVVWRDDVQVVQVTKAKRYGAMPGVSVSIAVIDPLELQAHGAALQMDLAA